jgi:curli biogenesis system outer membrane secretion channel CsgG
MRREGNSKRVLYRIGSFTIAAALVTACHHDEAATAASSASVPARAATVAPASALPGPVRAKPDFGSVGSEQVEATGVAPTLEAAIDNAIGQAVEQVNGKTVAGGSLSLSVDGSLAAGGQNMDYAGAEYAQWLATRTSGAVTHFRIISQQQKNLPLSTDEQRLVASQGESWNRGKFEGKASESSEGHARAGDDTGEARADASQQASISAEGEYDQHQGASNVDYSQKHTQFANQWEVKIAVDVAKYRESPGAKLTRVVVALPRVKQETYRVGDSSISSMEIATQVRAALDDAIVQTHRFTVLDRDATEEMGQEIELIESGNAKREDTARLSQQLAADLIVIPAIDRFEYIRHERQLHLSDRTLASYSGGGALSFRVVNAVTGQIVLSQSFDYALPDTAPTTLGASADGPRLAGEMMQALDGAIVGAILRSTFPLSIVQRDGRNVVINQGGNLVTQGATYQAVTMGKEVIDPQSGLSLGPTEAPCCTVAIDRVTSNLSYGHIVETDVDTTGPYMPGSMELRDLARPAKPAAPDVAAVVHSTRKKSVEAKVDGTNTGAKDKDW